MPQAVAKYVETRDFGRVDRVKRQNAEGIGASPFFLLEI